MLDVIFMVRCKNLAHAQKDKVMNEKAANVQPPSSSGFSSFSVRKKGCYNGECECTMILFGLPSVLLFVVLQVESFFSKHTSFPSQEEFASLAAVVQVESSSTASPMPVKCTKKLISNLVNHVDTVSISR